MYRFIRGQVCDSEDLTQERIWRGVARRLAEWHALLPVVAASEPTASNAVDFPSGSLLEPPSSRPSAAVINSITPSKLAPNVWTVIQKWIFALPTASELEKKRKNELQIELERTVAELGDLPSLGNNGVCLILTRMIRLLLGADFRSWSLLIVTY